MTACQDFLNNFITFPFIYLFNLLLFYLFIEQCQPRLAVKNMISKFGLSEKHTKFEKNLHLKFNATE